MPALPALLAAVALQVRLTTAGGSCGEDAEPVVPVIIVTTDSEGGCGGGNAFDDQWTRDGMSRGRPQWKRAGSEAEKIRWEGGRWLICQPSGAAVYSVESDAMLPPHDSWEATGELGCTGSPELGYPDRCRADSDPPSAITFVLTQDGMGNLPALFGDAIVRVAIEAANTKLREAVDAFAKDTLSKSVPNGWCAGDHLCHVKNNMVEIIVDNIDGAIGPHGDEFLGLKTYYPPSVEFEIEPCADGVVACLKSGELGTVKVSAQIEFGTKLGVRGYARNEDGPMNICCVGASKCGHFIFDIYCPWAGRCSCSASGSSSWDHTCGCNQVCDRPVSVSAKTPMEIEVAFFHKDKEFSVIVREITWPSLDADLQIDQGCLGEIFDHWENMHYFGSNWGLIGMFRNAIEAIFSLFAGHSKSTMFKQIEEAVEKELKQSIEDFLENMVPAHGRATCGEECNLPKGVTMEYILSDMGMYSHSDGNYIEALLDAEICAEKSLLPGGGGSTGKVCFGKDHVDVSPPVLSEKSFSDTGVPAGSRMLTGIRASTYLIDGVSWAMGEAGLFLTSSDIQALDAQLAFNVSWADLAHPPRMGVSKADNMYFEWSKGFVRVICKSIGIDMMDFRWTNMVGNGSLASSFGGCIPGEDMCECGDGDALLCGQTNKVCEQYETEHGCSGATNPVGRCVWKMDGSTGKSTCVKNSCMYPQVTDFDVSQSKLQLVEPHLPLPDEFVTELMDTMLTQGQEKLNAVLDDNTFCLPPRVNQYLGTSPPTTKLLNQHITSDSKLGFVQLASYCGPGFADCADTKSEQLAANSDELPSAGRAQERDRAVRNPGNEQTLQFQVADATPEPPEMLDSTSTYTRDGHKYHYGAFIMTFGGECKNPCPKAQGWPSQNETRAGECVATYFKDGECKDSVKRSCREGVYIEEHYRSIDCTGNLTENATTIPADVCSQSNLTFGLQTLEIGTMSVCPTRLPDPSPPDAHGIDAITCIMISLMTALGVLAVRFCTRTGQCITLGQTRTGQCITLGGSAVSAFCTRAGQWIGEACTTAGSYFPVVLVCCTRTGQIISLVCTAMSKVGSVVTAPCANSFRAAQAWCTNQSIRSFCVEAIVWVWPRLKRCVSALLEFCIWITTWRPRSPASFDAYDRVELGVNCCAAASLGLYAFLWHYNDPFEAFNKAVFLQIGVEGSDDHSVRANSSVDTQVQKEFSQWSIWGQAVQCVAAGLMVAAILFGLVEQIRPTARATMGTVALVIVAIGQLSMTLVPPFLYDLSVRVNESDVDPDSMLQDSDFRAEADNILTLALDGVALSFISSLFMFLLHGLAPGVFLGSCLFGAHLIFQRSKTERVEPAQPVGLSGFDVVSSARISMISESSSLRSGGSPFGNVRSSFTSGFTPGSLRPWDPTDTSSTRSQDDVKMPSQLLQQQQPRVRILNWLVCLGAPCGGCLPAIIVYQGIGASPRLAACFVFCWGLPTALMYPLIRVLTSRINDAWGERALAVTACVYSLLYCVATLTILLEMQEKFVAGGFEGFSFEFPLSTFLTSVVCSMALTNSYLRRALLLDSMRLKMAENLLMPRASVANRVQRTELQRHDSVKKMRKDGTKPAVAAPAPAPAPAPLAPAPVAAQNDGISRPASPQRSIDELVANWVASYCEERDGSTNTVEKAKAGSKLLSSRPASPTRPSQPLAFSDRIRGGSGASLKAPLMGPESELESVSPAQEQQPASDADGEHDATDVVSDTDAPVETTPSACRCLGATIARLKTTLSSACEWMGATCPCAPCFKACWAFVLNWLTEEDENADPETYGRRLPYRRVSLAIGTGLTYWVLWRDFVDNDKFVDSNKAQQFREALDEYDAGLQWPEGNATILDEAIDTYGSFTKFQFVMSNGAVILLSCACWCDWVVRAKVGLEFSRFFGFFGLAMLFFASLVTAAPNYMQVSHLNTLCPCCAKQFNFLFSTLLQDIAGIFLSSLFALKLLPVLLVVSPSIVRACTLIILDDITAEQKRNRQMHAAGINSAAERQMHEEAMRSYVDPTFSRANVDSVFSMCSMLTPIFTAIPMMVLIQLVRRPQYNQFSTLGMSNTTFVSVCLSVFYFIPMVIGWLEAKTTKTVLRRYFTWMVFYLVPLIILAIREISVLGYGEQAVDHLKEHWQTYVLEILCEVLVANVILSDVIYSNLYVERVAKKSKSSDWPAGHVPKLQLSLLVVIPAIALIVGMWLWLKQLKYFEVKPDVHFPVTDFNGQRDENGKCVFPH